MLFVFGYRPITGTRWLDVFAVIPVGDGSFGDVVGSILPASLSDNTVLGSNIVGLVFFALLLLTLLKFTCWRKKKAN